MNSIKIPSDIQLLVLHSNKSISIPDGCFVLLLFTEEAGYIRYNERIYDVSAHDCIFLHQTDEILLVPSHFKVSKVFCLTFYENQLSPLALTPSVLELMNTYLCAPLHIQSLSEKNYHTVFNLFDTFLSLSDDTLPHALLLKQHLINTLVFHLARLYDLSEIKQKKSRESTPHTVTVEQIRQYVQQNYSAPISLSSISKSVYTTPSYLSRIFKESTGMTLSFFINHVRIEAAKRMLLDTDELVIDIATACGFNYTTHFNKVFKDMTGMSPVQYKRTYKKSIF